VEHLFPVLEALFDERAQYPVLLVDVVEERANMPVLAETAPATPHGTAIHCHVFTSCRYGRVSEPNDDISEQDLPT
jgi:hypothetical protein